MFWGGERLKVELSDQNSSGKPLISDFTEKRIDHAAYRLRVGGEVYVSPTGEPDDPRNKPKTLLKQREGFTIPAGQFGFILTEERITVPSSAIAWISIRAKYKFRGLVNVSGFHVDPNYEGRLLFSVFNAGPGPVHLDRGEECFLIWYADLDGPSKVEKKAGFDSIPSEYIGLLASGLQSFSGLLSKMNESDKKLQDRLNALEREQAVIKWAAALIVGAALTLGLRQCSLPAPIGSQEVTDMVTTDKPITESPPAAGPTR